MSTKATIAYGENFHFYHKVMDEDHVYLEIETTHFEAGYGRVQYGSPRKQVTKLLIGTATCSVRKSTDHAGAEQHTGRALRA